METRRELTSAHIGIYLNVMWLSIERFGFDGDIRKWYRLVDPVRRLSHDEPMSAFRFTEISLHMPGLPQSGTGTRL